MPTFVLIFSYMDERIQLAAFATPWPDAFSLHRPSTGWAHTTEEPYHNDPMRILVRDPPEVFSIYAGSATSIHSPDMEEVNAHQINLSGFNEAAHTQAAPSDRQSDHRRRCGGIGSWGRGLKKGRRARKFIGSMVKPELRGLGDPLVIHRSVDVEVTAVHKEGC
ncbi:hypothetical protein D9613_006341 [Agrocybe pediades]|uniref:Uncharacterized protein n=1 Tax=Agrocybe pediades TaxID=84607 RepID=A0A8H4QVW7_9AGAR|nr:hypothetical protein D9613_006341 [Agrocybe pediades]